MEVYISEEVKECLGREIVFLRLFDLKRKEIHVHVHVQSSLHIMDTVSLLYRGVLYVEVILYSKECNWYTRCCPLNAIESVC